MSTYEAIAAVSETIEALLDDRMAEDVQITFAPPDVALTGLDGRGRVNLFLYQISENAYVRNQEIPGVGHPGAYGHPPLSLDLHYLMTTFSKLAENTLDADKDAQRILGDAMRVFHDYAIIPTTLVDQTSGDEILDKRLSNAFERVKITLQPVSLEDLSKIWTALPETSFRRSVAYHVSVIQIESKLKRRHPTPVGGPDDGGPKVFGTPLDLPRIEDVRVIYEGETEERQGPRVRIGDRIVVLGQTLSREGTRVYIGDVDVTDKVKDSSDSRLEFTVPDNPLLQPGAAVLQLRREIDLGKTLTAHAVLDSNAAVLQLVPRVTAARLEAGFVEITGTRLLREGHAGLTILDEQGVPASAYEAASTDLRIRFADPGGVSDGDPVRVRVDGAESIDSVKVNG